MTLIYAYKCRFGVKFSSSYISFIWSLKVLEKSLNLILTNGQEPCYVLDHRWVSTTALFYHTVYDICIFTRVMFFASVWL